MEKTALSDFNGMLVVLFESVLKDFIQTYFMKNFIGIIIFLVLISAFTKDRSGIMGTIDPPEGARRIWAVSGKDTVAIIPSPGSFIMDVKPGSWKLVIEAVLPYKNAEREGVLVTEGQLTDVGLIKLTQ